MKIEEVLKMYYLLDKVMGFEEKSTAYRRYNGKSIEKLPELLWAMEIESI